MKHERRQFVALAAGSAAGMAVAWPSIKPRHRVSYLKARYRVAVLEATGYSGKLEQLLIEGLRLFNLDVGGRSVLLKPNLVEHLPNRPVNTHPLLVGAAASCFLRLGVERVVVGEGPGHERDTEMVVCETGFEKELRDRGVEFIDLNRDRLIEVKLSSDCSNKSFVFSKSAPSSRSSQWFNTSPQGVVMPLLRALEYELLCVFC
jgi:hypothetical protein